jgi:hypothetical protein
VQWQRACAGRIGHIGSAASLANDGAGADRGTSRTSPTIRANRDSGRDDADHAARGGGITHGRRLASRE